MKRCLFLLPIWVCLLWGGVALAANVQVKDLRIGADAAKTRLVLELSGRVDFTIFALDNPRRIVVDLPTLVWREATSAQQGGVIKKLRFGQFTATTSRVVMELNTPAQIVKSFIIPPTSGFPHRLVIDLAKTDAPQFSKQVKHRDCGTFVATQSNTNDKPVIVIDAGHGGIDPGALGRKAREKDVTLTFARELAKQLRATGRYQIHLTRNRDIYIPLRRRVAIARKHSADLFVSIHADAISRKAVRGLSIYTLSETASDKEAAALARKENQSDIIAGIDFDHCEPDAADTLLSMAQRETKNSSVKFANLVVESAGAHTQLLERTHRFAGFRVLKAPDVPSVLIELGFLTNRRDEKQLLSKAWRKKVAGAFTEAIADYFASGRVARFGN